MSETPILSAKVAEFLLKINAVKLQPENPFTWASGWKSPIYCDNRTILSYPDKRNLICNYLVLQIEKNLKNFDIIAGVATGAIGIGMLVANKLNKPFVYVRSDRKKHGRKNSVEGFFQKNQKVVVIEDLISTGKSSLEACDSLLAEGLTIEGLVSIFNYNFDVSKKNFESKKIKYYSLCSYELLIKFAAKQNYISEKEIQKLKSWRSDPENWIK